MGKLNKLRFLDFLRPLNLEEESITKLKCSLDSVVAGNSTSVTTPLMYEYEKAIKDCPEDYIFTLWDPIFEANKHLIDDKLFEIEMNQKLKFGTRSKQIPWEERKPSVLSYFDPRNFDKGLASDIIQSIEPVNVLEPLDLKDAMLFIKNNTAASLPHFGKKIDQKVKLLENPTYFKELLDRKDPCILYTRTAEQGKTRTVWGYPIADTVLENKYYRPLLEYQRKSKYRAAIIGATEVDVAITKLLERAKREDKYCYSIDFSAYDASVSTTAIQLVFIYIKSLFTTKGENVKELNYICKRMNTIGLVTPDGVLSTPHGVPSGSTFTNEVDSLAQHLIARQYVDDAGGLGDHQIQGDDGAYVIKYPEKLSELFRKADLQVNKDKSFVSKDYFVYLQLYYSLKYKDSEGIARGIYPIYRAINRLINMEKRVDLKAMGIAGKDFFAIRSLSILENLKYHPMFTLFMDFIIKINKYDLDPSDSGIQLYIQEIEQKEGASDIRKNKRGEQISGLRTWASYTYVKTKMKEQNANIFDIPVTKESEAKRVENAIKTAKYWDKQLRKVVDPSLTPKTVDNNEKLKSSAEDSKQVAKVKLENLSIDELVAICNTW